jgi:hypothetical protein
MACLPFSQPGGPRPFFKGDLHFFAESSTRAKSNCEAKSMAPGTVVSGRTITRKRLVKKLNEDLARECQAIISMWFIRKFSRALNI